jgi:hypothetical protein
VEDVVVEEEEEEEESNQEEKPQQQPIQMWPERPDAKWKVRIP